jgi:hypothetical protein
MDFKLKVLSVVDPVFASLAKTQAVRDIYAHHGYDHTQMVDNLWFGWPSKLIGVIGLIRDLDPSYTHVMISDGADVVVLAPPEVVMERWASFGHPWVFNAEPHIWSPGSFTPEQYPTSQQYIYRYLNAGVSIGERAHVYEWFRRWTNDFTEDPQCIKGDQDWYAERFIRHYPEAIRLDHNCELFQCMCGSDGLCAIAPGHLYNRETDTDPLVIHFNGGTDITLPDRRLLWQHWIQ